MTTILTHETLQKLPKVELHCHLDGSVPLSVLEDLARRGKLGVPAQREALLRQVRAPQPCRSLAEYLGAFGLVLEVLTDMDALWQATYALGEELARENVVYAELRFAPLPLAGGATPDTVVRTVLDAMAAAQRAHGVVLRALLCMMRHMDEADNARVLDLAYRHGADGVAGVDLAGDEAAFPAPLYAGLFRRAADMGLAYTIHAGECGSADNVAQSVAMGARRIGHGIAAAGDPALCRTLAAEGVLLENCPTSNLQTGAVARWQDHPLPALARAGVPVCVSTDNRTISNTTLTDEYHGLASHFDEVDAAFLRARTLQALEGAFLPKGEKAALRAAIEAGFAALEPTPGP